MKRFIIFIFSLALVAVPLLLHAESDILLTVPSIIASSKKQQFIDPEVAYPDEEVSILPNYSAMRTLNNEIKFVGEVYNNTSVIVRFIKVTVSIFDGEGQFITSNSAFTYRENLPPGQSACFKLLFPAPENAKSYKFSEVFYLTDGIETPKLTVMNSVPGFDSSTGRYKIEGIIGNDNNFAVSNVKVIGTMYGTYSDESRVAGCDFNYVNSRDLSSGQTSEFELIFDDRFIIHEISQYRMAVEGN